MTRRLVPWLACALVGCAFGDDRLHAGEDGDAAVAVDAAATDGRPPVDAAIDAGVDAPPVACTLVPQAGCPGGRACDITAVGDTVCREVTVPGTSDDACASLTQCAGGYSCIQVAGEGVCLGFCTSDAGCAPATGSRCVIDVVDASDQPIPGATFCSQACAPRTGAGCPASWNCAVFDDAGGDYTRCIPAGTGTQDATCTSQLGCASGYDCVTHGSATTCARDCRVGVSGDCTGGLTCHGFSNTPLVIGAVEWGVCL